MAKKNKEKMKEEVIVEEVIEELDVPDTAVVPDTTVDSPVVKKEKKLILNIIRGRIPAVLVYAMRFGDNKGLPVKDLAEIFGTTVGKVTDIIKNDEFKYITSEFAPTQVQVNDGIEHMKRHVKYETGNCDKLINELESYELATTAQAEAFLALKKAGRGQSIKTKSGKVANAGGGNKRKAKVVEEEVNLDDVDVADLLD